MACEIPYEELAAYADGDLTAERFDKVRRHLRDCPSCRQRLGGMRRVEALLKELGRGQPPVQSVLAARRALSQAIRPAATREILTLEEAAEFLRLTPQQLGEIVEELPAFELAGQIRIRRERLIQWVQQRERDYSRQASESWVAQARVLAPETGVA